MPGTDEPRGTSAGAAQTVSRETLYERVWSTPIQTLAKEFGISDVALAKHCRKLLIPLPGRGHWAKVAAGKPVKRAKLRPLPPNSTRHRETTFRPKAEPAPPVATPAPVAEQEEFEANPANRIIVADSLRSAHPLVRKTAELLRLANDSTPSFVRSPAEQQLDIRASKACVARALRITDALVKAFERRGWKVTINSSGDQYRRTVASVVTVLGRPMRFGVRELIKKILNEPAKPERLPNGHIYTPYQSKYRDEWSGRLALVTRSSWGDAVETQLAETATGPLEDSLNDFMLVVVRRAYEEVERERRWEIERQARLVAEQQRLEEERRRALAVAREKALVDLANRWALHGRVTDFVRAARSAAEQRGESCELGTSVGDWLAWAERTARSIDPFGDSVAGMVAAAWQPRRRDE